ncbi:erythromycin esterase family protein [Longivirga aurantiaca]|uniref:Erythromycin esterase family protein n=1 Tax=Longivirga aurantiaca TaxID=1837743 RepID=A0ABW1T1S8_9ACTN
MTTFTGESYESAAAEARSLAHPLETPADLDPLLARIGDARYVCIGEASHGTHEFYAWRAQLTRRLVEERGVTWIGVEGDWPDCWRINRWVRGQDDQDLDVRGLLGRFSRWPTWMWANHDVGEFLVWLRETNRGRPLERRVGFYGLDVYSLWDSLRATMAWLGQHDPEALPTAWNAWRCFMPYGEDPHRYARAARLIPESCEDEVVALLTEVRRRVGVRSDDDELAFDAACNAEAAADAESYYRAMVRGDRASWNVRDHHMAGTIDRIARHLGPGSAGVVWEHNTHVGDARATDMARAGLVTVGQLVRERHESDGVVLVGFASHRGSVLAAGGWGEPERVMPLPVARAGSHEWVLHQCLPRRASLVFPEDRSGPWLSTWAGHRAVGVVYDPSRESGNYVPTWMGGRYDALLWFDTTTALVPLRHEPRPTEPEYETEPSGL